MEHEFEKIRIKVAQAEQNPVAWEKELVWSKVRQPERKNFIFYYAAASLLIASAIFFYAYERTKQREIELQLKAIELSIEENKTLQASIGEGHVMNKSIACVEEVEPRETKTSISPQRKIDNAKTKEIATPVIIEQEPGKELINNTVAVIETITATPEITDSVTEPISSKKIQAIIGSYDQGSASTIKDKKLKFRLFPPEENTETVPAAAEAISFHSKIN